MPKADTFHLGENKKKKTADLRRIFLYDPSNDTAWRPNRHNARILPTSRNPMTTTAKPAQRTFRLWAKMALLPVLLVSLLAAFGYSGTLSARDLLLESDSAIDNTSGEIRARRILHLKSGGDIINDSTTSSASGSSANSAYRKETIDRRGRIILDGEGGEEDNSKGGMHLYAGENIESRTGDIENRNSGSQSYLSGKNVHFDVRTLDNRFTLNSGGESRLGAPGREYLSERAATDHGSRIQGKGDITHPRCS